MASERVSTETVSKAVDSLLKWRKSRLETEKPKLFDQDEEFVYVILTLKKIPQNGRVNPHKIPLPHSLLSPSSEQCLIIDDRPKTVRITKDEAQKKIKSEAIPISKVLKLSKLASDYRPFEAKRKLCGSYDLFFADKAIVPLLPRLLGKQFFKKRKLPVQIDLKKKNWKEQVESACSSAMLFLRTGTCSVLKVAKLCMERDEIVENVVAAIDGVVEIVPKKWANVRSFHVKLLDSVALPIYQVVPDMRLKIEGVRDTEEAAPEKNGKDGKSAKKKTKKKGRIHEIKYMDDKMSEDGDDHDEVDGDDNDGGSGDTVDNYENGEMGSGGLVNKKRKKGIKVKTKSGESSELGSVKPLKESAKGTKKDGDDNGGGDKVDDYENGERGSGGLVSKKRKKGVRVKTKTGDSSEVESMKQLKEFVKRKKEGGNDNGGGAGGDTEDDYENGERGSGGLVSKKRKKGIKVKTKTGESSELGNVKPLKESAKRKKKDGLSAKAVEEVLIKKSKNKSSVEDEGLGKKKRVDGKIKAKKSKKAA